MECKEHLFSKNISDHSIRALKELYREVGQSFEAVNNGTACVFQTGSVTSSQPLKESSSFRSRINELQNLLSTQGDELEYWQSKAASEGEMRREAEANLAGSERMTRAVLEDNQRLEQHIEDWKLIAEQCEERREGLAQVARKALACLKEVDLDLDG